MLRAVIVDVGGTLWPERLSGRVRDDACLAQLSRILPGLDPVQSLAVLRAGLRDDDQSLVQNTHALLEIALRRLGVQCADGDLLRIRPAMCVPAAPDIGLFPGARQLLEIIRDLGLRSVVLSNVQVRGADEYWRDFFDLGVPT